MHQIVCINLIIKLFKSKKNSLEEKAREFEM